MKTQELKVTEEIIIGRIHIIRDQKVMLDEDLAELYHVTTGRLNEQVKRNLKRFPGDFMFQLTEIEFESLISQIATSKRGGRRKPPFAFTDLGVAMLSSVLNSDYAISTNIQIMRVFARLKQISITHAELQLAIEEIKQKTLNNSSNIEILFSYFDELLDKKENPVPREQIGYKTL